MATEESVVDGDALCAVVASGEWCRRHGVSAVGVGSVFAALKSFSEGALRAGKGVALPSFGTLAVGSVLPESCLVPSATRRPTFTLHAKFQRAISSERGRFFPAGPPVGAKLNYGAIASAAQLSRHATQEIVKQLFAALGAALLGGAPIAVDFGVGVFTSQSGRTEFRFHADFLAYWGLAPEKHADFRMLTKKAAPSAPPPPAPAPKALKAPKRAPPPPPSMPAAALEPVRPSTPAMGAFLKQCKALDRLNAGCVLKTAVAKLLEGECADFLPAPLDEDAVADLLDAHTYGKTGKFVAYRPLAQAVASYAPSTAAPLDAAEAPAAEVLVVPDEPADGDEPVPPRTAAWEAPVELDTFAATITKPPDLSASRVEVESYNRSLAAQRKEMLSRTGVTPKVSNNPMMANTGPSLPCTPLAEALSHQVNAKHVSKAELRHAEVASDLERLAVAKSLLDSEAAAVAEKKAATRKLLRESWDAQLKHKAELAATAKELESRWPYGPTTYKRPVTAPAQE